MGSDQSHPVQSVDAPGSSRAGQGAPLRRDDGSYPDPDVPYVSYTLNKPIGESPKKSSSSSYRFSSPRLSKRRSAAADCTKNSSLVLVNKPADLSQDHFAPELARLKEIPLFLPVMRASLGSGPIVKDPDILERLDHRGLLDIGKILQASMGRSAGCVASEQAELARAMRDLDDRVWRLWAALAERQKQHAKIADQLKKVADISNMLAKAHSLLNHNLEQLETLNNLLPVDQRHEPFVWTTG